MTRISDHIHLVVLCKMQVHTNIKKVTKDLHLCRSIVRNIWKKFLETGSISDKKKSGRPLILSERGRQNLSTLPKMFPFCGPFDLLQGSTCYQRCSEVQFSGIYESQAIGYDGCEKADVD